jgi:nuclear transport factor 2 (NTF2) superfamily protein
VVTTRTAAPSFWPDSFPAVTVVSGLPPSSTGRSRAWTSTVGVRPDVLVAVDHRVSAASREAFLTRKWAREPDYRLIKELWAFTGDRIAVRFAYEWHDDSGNWFRSYGNENWHFDQHGLMRERHACINDLPITEDQHLFHWPQSRRPDDHPD